jgi:flagellar biosynthesis protein
MIKKRAVALRYKNEESEAPKVVAKGSGSLADEIVRRAEEAGVPLYRDDALVEVLAQIELDREIPPELFGAVAEIMSWIYKADKELRS